MNPPSMSDPTYRRRLGGGLVLRWSEASDTERLVELYSYVFRNKPDAPLNERLSAWVRDLMSGRHPLITPGDFALVEDTDRGMIVAATCLLSQTWEYGGIPFPVGRPEIVASHPDYRNRGLIRAVFELIHARSAALGHIAQGITGIRYYYRQFGYEYALDLEGSHSVYFTVIPALDEGKQEPYTLRDATPEDLPFVLSLYERERARAIISTRIDEKYWRYLLEGINPESGEGWDTQLILNSSGEPVGYVLPWSVRHGPSLIVIGMAIRPGLPLVDVLPSVLRALQARAAKVPPSRYDTPAPNRLTFILGRDHPVYRALDNELRSVSEPPYAWYVRVPDLPAFIRRIAPVLERRLADSVVAGYSGDLKLDFYRGGLRLLFDDGKLAGAEEWRAPVWGSEAQGGFPPLVFLQLLFGRRSLAELRYAFPDVWAKEHAIPLLEALFPPQLSWVLPLN